MYSQCGVNGSTTEIDFYNHSDFACNISFYPISAVFTKDLISTGSEQLYTLLSRGALLDQYTSGSSIFNRDCYYLNNIRVERNQCNNNVIKSNTFSLPANATNHSGLNFDPAGNPSAPASLGSFGYGRYKIIFDFPSLSVRDSCIYECDGRDSGINDAPDLFLIIVGTSSNNLEIKYMFT